MPQAISSRNLISHLAETVRKTPLNSDPFSHIQIDEVFPLAFYEEIMAAMPETRFYGELQHNDAKLPNGRSARRKLELSPAHLRRLPAAQRDLWTSVAEAFQSPEMEAAYREKFEGALRERFPGGLNQVQLHPIPLLIRDLGGYKISIHCDSFRKAVTTQYYLPSNRSQIHLGTSFHAQGNGGPIKIKTLEFAPNTGYAFAVTANSWHSVEKMTSADGERNSLMLIYYIDQGPVGELLNSMKRLALDARVLCTPRHD